MRQSAFLSSAVVAGLAFVGGCGSYHDGYANDNRGRHDSGYVDRDRDRAEMAGHRNTVISDIQDDGVRNGTARSYDERKASRAADEGDRGAAYRERELRREREYGR